jgi:dTDP-4-dehydrorhamnose reductase
MRIFILGSSGMLGTYLKKFFQTRYELVCPLRKDIDFCDDEDKIKKFFEKNLICENDIIINAAGIIKQRKTDLIQMIKVNSVLPHILADIKNKTKCQVIHITTDCVFSGKKGKYSEIDVHDCEDEYGKSKSLGENKDLTTIRTSIIGEELHNKLSLCEWVKSQNNKTINGFTNHLWNGVTCLELSKIIYQIIQSNNFWLGVRHFHSPNTLSKYDLVSAIGKHFNINVIVIPTESNSCFRDLTSIYKIDYNINDLEKQIKEMSQYKL